jgi:hypothetical protein
VTSAIFLRRKGASDYLEKHWGLKRTARYLAKLAVVGGGPAFRKANRDALYTTEDLDEWALSLIGPRIRSTAEVAKSRKG